MSDRATLLELAERVEKAEGPDRELDREIYGACWALSCLMDSCDGDEECFWRGIGHYTASLDAALTLVPEGWCYSVTRKESGLHVACVWRGPATCCKATATPALALTAAALRARAEGMPGA